jgi:hypothetical protein
MVETFVELRMSSVATQDFLPHLFGVRRYPLLDIPKTPYSLKDRAPKYYSMEKS